MAPKPPTPHPTASSTKSPTSSHPWGGIAEARAIQKHRDLALDALNYAPDARNALESELNRIGWPDELSSNDQLRYSPTQPAKKWSSRDMRALLACKRLDPNVHMKTLSDNFFPYRSDAIGDRMRHKWFRIRQQVVEGWDATNDDELKRLHEVEGWTFEDIRDRVYVDFSAVSLEVRYAQILEPYVAGEKKKGGRTEEKGGEREAAGRD